MTPDTTESLDADLKRFTTLFGELKTEIQKAIVGYDELLVDTLVAIFSQGHVLLEGVPGLGKTFLVKVVSQVIGVEPGRVQCTPDLMPGDILGTQIVNEDEHGRRVLHFEKGPVFKNILLVDEINRATPKTQAALLEVMQEHAVTTGGERHPLPVPFFVLATQNPMEMEGTYPLPEAQLDRFIFKIRVPFPDLASLVEISKRTTRFDATDLKRVMTGEQLLEFQKTLTHVPIADPLTEYAARLVLATHPETPGEHQERIGRYVAYGASPRGLQALVRGARVHAALDGRTAVSLDDIKRVAIPSLRHRIILNFEGEAESIDIASLINDLVEGIPTPAQEAA
ncbi:MoxR family ATPase [soil metagenome]